MRNTLPCVGLVVLVGCLTFVIVPDDPTPRGSTEPLTYPRAPMIVIDAGHGGHDVGARANGLLEKDLTLDLAKRLEKLCHNAGLNTVMTRADDTFVDLYTRAEIANRHQPTAFVSIHINHAKGPLAAGVETFYARQKVAPKQDWTWAGLFTEPEPLPIDNGENLAGAVQAALVQHTNATNRGIKAREFAVVRYTRCPAILVEAGFISNAFEARLLATPEYRDRVAAAIAEGLFEWLKTQLPEDEPLRFAQLKR